MPKTYKHDATQASASKDLKRATQETHCPQLIFEYKGLVIAKVGHTEHSLADWNKILLMQTLDFLMMNKV
jgi:hypothetical protein